MSITGLGGMLRNNWARAAFAITLRTRCGFPEWGSRNSAEENLSGARVVGDVPGGHGPGWGASFAKFMVTFGLGASSAFQGEIGRGGNFTCAAPNKSQEIGGEFISNDCAAQLPLYGG